MRYCKSILLKAIAQCHSRNSGRRDAGRRDAGRREYSRRDAGRRDGYEYRIMSKEYRMLKLLEAFTLRHSTFLVRCGSTLDSILLSFAKRYWAIAALLLWSCEGEIGPPGPEGPRGPVGPEGPPLIGLMYEIVFDLDSANDWQAIYDFPSEDEIFLEDVVLVYLLWDQVETDGDPLDVWRLMPVNYFYDEGILQINYDFTVEDVRIFAEAAFPLDSEIDIFNDFVARIVVVPADFSPNARKTNTLDFSDYAAVKKAYDLPETERSRGKPIKEIMKAYQDSNN